MQAEQTDLSISTVGNIAGLSTILAVLQAKLHCVKVPSSPERILTEALVLACIHTRFGKYSECDHRKNVIVS